MASCRASSTLAQKSIVVCIVECLISLCSTGAFPLPSCCATRQPKPFRSRCVDSLTPASFA